MRWRSGGWCLVALAAVVVAGCGRAGPSRVRGVVTLDGSPVAGATVLFEPDGDEAGHPASGFTASDGTFELTTYRTDDGALPGAYRVLVQKREPAKDRQEGEQSAMDRAKAKYEGRAVPKDKKASLPDVYAKFDTTPFRFTVPTGEVKLELHKDGK